MEKLKGTNISSILRMSNCCIYATNTNFINTSFNNTSNLLKHLSKLLS
jgi:hypothetical protein